jgi:hypothetical protein
MKAKRIIAITMAVTMMITNAIPTLADIIRKKTVDDTTLIYTDNAHNISYPCWIWISGYAYYYQNAATILKNTTTPDGYAVDDQGRWIVNGVPQTNGYGNHFMGTSDYNGKSNDEIWSSLVNKLEPIFIDGVAIGEINLMISPRELSYDSSKYTYGSDISIWKNSDNFDVVKKESFRTFITARIGNSWSDEIKDVSGAWAKMAYADSAEIKEKTIKAVVGDVIGKELFDYIRPHADQISHSGGYTIAIDENGNTIKGWRQSGFQERPATKEDFIEEWKGEIEYRRANNVLMEYPVPDLENLPEPEPYGDYDLWFNDPNGTDEKVVWIEDISDGINPKALDLSQWQNRTTDYGKQFRVSNDEGLIVIYVYN